jgi:hypothetical protein
VSLFFRHFSNQAIMVLNLVDFVVVDGYGDVEKEEFFY